MKKLLVILTIAIVGAYSAAVVAYNSRPEPEVVEQAPLPTRGELLRLVNEERAKVGVAPLVMDERLNQSAQMKVDDMVKYDYFAHENYDGSFGAEYVFETTGTLCSHSGENISFHDDGAILSPVAAVQGWVNSKSHYEAMTRAEHTITGFGIADNVVVQHFCKET